MNNEKEESIIPESSISQRVEQSSATDLSKSKPEPNSIDDYFIVRDTPKYLEEIQHFLSKKSDFIYQLRGFI
jgi:hypothetical protein